MICKRGILDVGVHKGAEGFFLGVIDRQGIIQCRLTGFAQTEAQARKLPQFCQLSCMHDDTCNSEGCFNRK